MKIILFTFLLFSSLIFLGCNNESDLKSSETPEYGYSVPQGNHDYDAIIVDWKKRFNTYFLYKFIPRDIYWTGNFYEEAHENDTTAQYLWTEGISYTLADENYVGKQLDLLKESFLNFYPDSLLREWLPLKVLLCGEYYRVNVEGIHIPYYSEIKFDYIAVNWGREEINSMTTVQQDSFRTELNYAFLKNLILSKKIVLPPEFYAKSPEMTVSNRTMYSNGFIKNGTKIPSTDFDNFVEAIVKNTYDELIEEMPSNNYSYKGILHPNKDVNGKIREKYDIVTDYFKTAFGIDLQSIGNAKKS